MRLRLLLLLLGMPVARQQMGLCVISEETQASQTRRSRRGRHQRWRCLVDGNGRGMSEHYRKAKAERKIGSGSLKLARVDRAVDGGLCGPWTRRIWSRIKQFKQLEAGIGRWAGSAVAQQVLRLSHHRASGLGFGCQASMARMPVDATTPLKENRENNLSNAGLFVSARPLAKEARSVSL